ncbi:hypothetical protein BRARA_B01597 [Brassica rapa]|uniref:Uncharacterized protein n=1 Tax=Brassica campestris TaxID=3711 RepID=A0A398A9I3_BRACM|nr:hypothetical protein BRARA_B01597 [Brassica rapa]
MNHRRLKSEKTDNTLINGERTLCRGNTQSTESDQMIRRNPTTTMIEKEKSMNLRERNSQIYSSRFIRRWCID